MKVMLIVGTRPEVVKVASVYRALADAPDMEPILCVTGQHRQMLDQFLKVCDLKPDVDLDLMQANQDLFDLTSRCILGLRDTLTKMRPDMVLVQGDTTTSMAGALSAFYLRIPIGHIEAGLRTFNLAAPFPEEGNRAIISRIADLHFAPTEQSRRNLLAENLREESVSVTGNTVIDSLLWMHEQVKGRKDWGDRFGTAGKALFSEQPLILVTGHRRENFGDGFNAICRAISRLAVAHPDWNFVYPVHLNPNVQEPVRKTLGSIPNVFLLPPLEYPEFVFALGRARLVLTDSGGVQEEAPTLGKPVLVMRETTERPEAVSAGTAKLVGTDEETIVTQTTELMTKKDQYEKMAKAHNPFGDGHASRRIVEAIRKTSRAR